MIQAEKLYEQYLKSCCVLQDHYDDERNKTVLHNTTPDLQDQDRNFWSETGLVLRPTVSDHITDHRGLHGCRTDVNKTWKLES